MSKTDAARPTISVSQLPLPLDSEYVACNSGEATPESMEILRVDILSHFQSLGLPFLGNDEEGAPLSKESIRASHAFQRSEYYQREQRALARKQQQLLTHFANGSEIRPESINPELVPVNSDDETGEVFRFATLLWSVPVSRGYGRRMRYLVRDRSNGKLIGIFALGDPVFNLRARDSWIGWDVNDRRARLVNLMDAYVVGAVPPYSQLLGGKLVASLIGSAEVSRDFAKRYSGSTGIISKQKKDARLVLVTITSALGRSSLYNRLKLTAPSHDEAMSQNLVELVRIGTTLGYGHFQLSEALFERLRKLLIQEGHSYAFGHQFGQGPNWRMRVARVGLQKLGLDPELIRHGISREIYAMPLAANFRDFLCGKTSEPDLQRLSAACIATAALERWILPRAARRPEYAAFKREQMLDFVGIGEPDVSSR